MMWSDLRFFSHEKKSSEMAWSSCWNHRILALLRHLSSSHRRSIWSEHAGIGFMIYVFHEILESCEWLASQFACTQFMDSGSLAWAGWPTGGAWPRTRGGSVVRCGVSGGLLMPLMSIKAWEIPLWSLCYPRLPHLLHFLRIRAKIE